MELNAYNGYRNVDVGQSKTSRQIYIDSVLVYDVSQYYMYIYRGHATVGSGVSHLLCIKIPI